MSENLTRLSRLIDLAKETSSDRRRDLLREVTDAFLEDPTRPTEIERDHFGAILSLVATQMDVAVRNDLASRFADIPSAPANLIRQLANDEFSVAKDVLAKSTALSDDDLIAIARSKSQDKLHAIAGRTNVSEGVSDAIVEHGHDEVVLALVTNAGAKLARNTFQRVVERSETSAVLQAPLVARADLPADMLQDMFSFVSAELRTKVMQKLESLPREVIDRAFADAAKDFTAGVREMKAADRKAMVFVSEMAASKRLNEALLCQLVQSEQTVELIHAFARLSEIDLKTSRRIFTSRNVEGVAIACKATRFDRSTFSTIAVFLEQSQDGKPKNVNELIALYDRVPAEAAQRVMRFWRVRKEATKAPQAVAKAG